MSAREYDLVILGGGTGGYVAAIRAAQLGKSVAVVEKDKLGGTCLHRGCIPSKSLLRSAQMFAEMKQADTYGVRADSVTLDFARVQERKQEIVGELYEGVQTLMRKNRIDVYEGRGCLIGPSIFRRKAGRSPWNRATDKMKRSGKISRDSLSSSPPVPGPVFFRAGKRTAFMC